MPRLVAKRDAVLPMLFRHRYLAWQSQPVSGLSRLARDTVGGIQGAIVPPRAMNRKRQYTETLTTLRQATLGRS